MVASPVCSEAALSATEPQQKTSAVKLYSTTQRLKLSIKADTKNKHLLDESACFYII